MHKKMTKGFAIIHADLQVNFNHLVPLIQMFSLHLDQKSWIFLTVMAATL